MIKEIVFENEDNFDDPIHVSMDEDGLIVFEVGAAYVGFTLDELEFIIHGFGDME